MRGKSDDQKSGRQANREEEFTHIRRRDGLSRQYKEKANWQFKPEDQVCFVPTWSQGQQPQFQKGAD